MKKSLWLALGFTALALVSTVHAAPRASGEFILPQDRDGAMVLNVQQTGVYVFNSSMTVSTVSLQGPLAIFGVITSSKGGGSAGQEFVFLRSTPNNLGVLTNVELLVPPIALSSAACNTLVVFDPPVIATSGVSMFVSTPGSSAALFYRYLSTGQQENVLMPTDLRGAKVLSADFYGVEVSTDPAAIAGSPADSIGAEVLDNVSVNSQIYGSTSNAQKVLWYGWSAGTGTAQNYMVVNDSTSLIGTSPVTFLPPIMYRTLTLEQRIFGDSAFVQYRWPWPLILTKGFQIQRFFPTSQGSPDRFRAYGRPANRVRWNR